MVQLLRPWSANVGKRVVKAPKVYLRDTGLLHTLLRLQTKSDLDNHPKLGASFEGFALSTVIRRLAVSEQDCYFWSTYQESELDLLVARGTRRLGFEFKHTVAPEVTKSMQIALSDLDLERLDVVHVGKETYPLAKQIRAVAFDRLHRDIEQLS
jgi:predicted AAA+ superfamily ATPase